MPLIHMSTDSPSPCCPYGSTTKSVDRSYGQCSFVIDSKIVGVDLCQDSFALTLQKPATRELLYRPSQRKYLLAYVTRT